jgi:hypothetical protein
MIKMEIDMKFGWLMVIECKRWTMNKVGRFEKPRISMADSRTVNLQ